MAVPSAWAFVTQRARLAASGPSGFANARYIALGFLIEAEKIIPVNVGSHEGAYRLCRANVDVLKTSHYHVRKYRT